MAPAGPWELTFLGGVGTYFSRVSAKKKFWCFFGVFLVFLLFLGGVFCVFFVFFCVFRARRENFFDFFFRGDFFFSRGREQNVKFPLCSPSAANKIYFLPTWWVSRHPIALLALSGVRNLAADVRTLAADVRNLAADVRNLAADVRNFAAGLRNFAADLRDYLARS